MHLPQEKDDGANRFSLLNQRGVLHFCFGIFYAPQEQCKELNTHTRTHNNLFDKQVRGGSVRHADRCRAMETDK